MGIWFAAGIPCLLLAAVLWFFVWLGRYQAKAAQYLIRIKAEGQADYNKTVKPGQVVLAGDSITEGLPTELLEDFAASQGMRVYNRGISGETSGQLLERLEASLLAPRPAFLVLLTGTNDLGQRLSPGAAAQNVRDILARTAHASPQTRVVVTALTPVNEQMPQWGARRMVGARKNKDIALLNGELEAAARAAGALWLDHGPALRDEDGQLKREYTYDGLHPNAAGNRVMARGIEAALREALALPAREGV